MENQPDGDHPDSDYNSEYEDEGGPVKSFLEHLEDLRWVLIKSSIALGIGFLICLIGGDKIVKVLKWPLDRAVRLHFKEGHWVSFLAGTNRLGTYEIGTNQPLANILTGGSNHVILDLVTVQVGTNFVLGLRPSTNEVGPITADDKMQLSNFGPAAGFMVAFQIAIYAGLVLASPFIFYFLAQFIFPALRMNEKKYVYRGLGVGFGLFMLGVSFCYFVLLPMALNASVAYSNWLGFSAMQWRAEEYISFVCKFMLGMGLGFEMPVVILVLVQLGIVTSSQLAAFRKFMIVINLILGAVLTTPEVITQVMMAIPLQVLYEISIWLARRIERKREREERERELAGN